MKILIALITLEILIVVVLVVFKHTIVSGAVLTPSRAIITAYSSEESQTDSTPFLTASQKQVQEGFIACPRKYPFGQRVEIAGKTYTCEDRKNIRYESYPDEYFDIWFPTTEEALEFGIKKLEIVLK